MGLGGVSGGVAGSWGGEFWGEGGALRGRCVGRFLARLGGGRVRVRLAWLGRFALYLAEFWRRGYWILHRVVAPVEDVLKHWMRFLSPMAGNIKGPCSHIGDVFYSPLDSLFIILNFFVCGCVSWELGNRTGHGKIIQMGLLKRNEASSSKPTK